MSLGRENPAAEDYSFNTTDDDIPYSFEGSLILIDDSGNVTDDAFGENTNVVVDSVDPETSITLSISGTTATDGLSVDVSYSGAYTVIPGTVEISNS